MLINTNPQYSSCILRKKKKEYKLLNVLKPGCIQYIRTVPCSDSVIQLTVYHTPDFVLLLYGQGLNVRLNGTAKWNCVKIGLNWGGIRKVGTDILWTNNNIEKIL